MQANLSKRINELLVLAVLERGPAHGYQVALAVSERTGGAFTFKHGTLYPILHRLESSGHLVGQWDVEDRPGARRRKTYSITEKGRAFLTEDSARLRGELDALFELVGRDDAA